MCFFLKSLLWRPVAERHVVEGRPLMSPHGVYEAGRVEWRTRWERRPWWAWIME
jgi:hypothetical protein